MTPDSQEKEGLEELRCDICGEEYELVWYAPNDLWNRINGGPTGKMCPRCFDLACQEQGQPIVWRGHVPGEVEPLDTGQLVEKERLLSEASQRERLARLKGWATARSLLDEAKGIRAALHTATQSKEGQG